MTKQRYIGFTLIELLVVVAIIVALIAILLPSLNRAIEISHRAVCGSNLKQTHTANLAFAAERFGSFATGKPVSPFGNSGVYAVWTRGASYAGYEEYGEFNSHGVLAALGYTDAKTFYCPSSVCDITVYGEQSSLPQGGGWFEDRADVPASQIYFWTTYVMRTTYGGSPYTAAKVVDVKSSDAMMADMFPDPQYNRDVRQVHIDGYNVVYGSGSVSWFADPDEYVRNYYNGGQAYFTGATGYLVMEEVWRDVFSR